MTSSAGWVSHMPQGRSQGRSRSRIVPIIPIMTLELLGLQDVPAQRLGRRHRRREFPTLALGVCALLALQPREIKRADTKRFQPCMHVKQSMHVHGVQLLGTGVQPAAGHVASQPCRRPARRLLHDRLEQHRPAVRRRCPAPTTLTASCMLATDAGRTSCRLPRTRACARAGETERLLRLRWSVLPIAGSHG